MSVTKRLLDVAASAAGLLVLSPVMLVVAAIVKLADGGPVLFRQERIGRNGKPFRILKFRTMRPDAERDGPRLTAGGDARVTGPGRWLRRYKLDELPQLWNVLRGEMSLVGPRPEVPDFVRRYTAEQRAILAHVPGITDPASVRYADEEALLAGAEDPISHYVNTIMPDKIRINLEYAVRAGTLSDIGVIVHTVARIMIRPRARD